MCGFRGEHCGCFQRHIILWKKRAEYLHAAKAIYRFLPRCTDKDGRMYFLVTEDGKELQKRRYYFSETFAAIGCAEYYKATGDEEALLAAEHYFKVAYECYKGIRPLQPKFHPTNYDMKALSPVMILLSTAQVLRSIEKIKQKYNTIAEECLKEILSGGYLTDRGLLEHVHMDGSAADTPTGRIVNPGHSLENGMVSPDGRTLHGAAAKCVKRQKKSLISHCLWDWINDTEVLLRLRI